LALAQMFLNKRIIIIIIIIINGAYRLLLTETMTALYTV
jgi:hypothetical protein